METLKDFASRIGADLKPTHLEDMEVIKELKNEHPDNFFCGMDKIHSWLHVKDPSVGVNGEGYWPFMVTKSDSGKTKIVGCGY